MIEEIPKSPSLCPAHGQLREVLVELRSKQDTILEYISEMKDLMSRVIKIEERNHYIIDSLNELEEKTSDLMYRISEIENHLKVSEKYSIREHAEKLVLWSAIAAVGAGIFSFFPMLMSK